MRYQTARLRPITRGGFGGKAATPIRSNPQCPSSMPRSWRSGRATSRSKWLTNFCCAGGLMESRVGSSGRPLGYRQSGCRPSFGRQGEKSLVPELRQFSFDMRRQANRKRCDARRSRPCRNLLERSGPYPLSLPQVPVKDLSVRPPSRRGAGRRRRSGCSRRPCRGRASCPCRASRGRHRRRHRAPPG